MGGLSWEVATKPGLTVFVLPAALYAAAELKTSHLLVLGDFNFLEINWNIWSAPSDNLDDISNVFIEQVRDCYLYQHTIKPTRSHNIQILHILDLIITNEEDMVGNIEYHNPLDTSDHCVIDSGSRFQV